MAKGSKQIKRWITINDNRVPIYEDGTMGGVGAIIQQKGNKKSNKKSVEAETKKYQDEGMSGQEIAETFLEKGYHYKNGEWVEPEERDEVKYEPEDFEDEDRIEMIEQALKDDALPESVKKQIVENGTREERKLLDKYLMDKANAGKQKADFSNAGISEFADYAKTDDNAQYLLDRVEEAASEGKSEGRTAEEWAESLKEEYGFDYTAVRKSNNSNTSQEVLNVRDALDSGNTATTSNKEVADMYKDSPKKKGTSRKSGGDIDTRADKILQEGQDRSSKYNEDMKQLRSSLEKATSKREKNRIEEEIKRVQNQYADDMGKERPWKDVGNGIKKTSVDKSIKVGDKKVTVKKDKPISKSSIEVNTNEFVGAHGKRPSGRGTWAFFIGGSSEPVFFSGSYSEAKQKAIAEAQRRGVKKIRLGS